VWPADDDRPPDADATGDELPPLPGEHAVAVRHHGELLGALTLDTAPGVEFTSTEQRLLDDVASQAGIALRNARLTEELRAHVEELRSSRQRLVSAQDTERRRLERDIHDGAQQQLVALAVKARLAEQLADRDPAKAREVMGEVRADATEALETLRDLARGIYPPVLADRGLVEALDAQMRKAPIDVRIEAGDLGRFRQDVEATVYFCCLEAVQNAAKYAEPHEVRIELAQEDGSLAFRIVDDGRGFDPRATRPGMGLTNMRDRVEAAGGALRIDTAPGNGTAVEGSVPAVPAS
jgi:signal transduction histidine kinase